jgi:uncharacterized membrane-anchored protein
MKYVLVFLSVATLAFVLGDLSADRIDMLTLIGALLLGMLIPVSYAALTKGDEG